MRGSLAAVAALLASAAAALDGAALRHYAAGESAAAHGAYEMAGGHFGKALAILEADGRAESEDAARLLAEMAEMARLARDRERAVALMSRALALTERVVGRDHPDHAARAERLAELRAGR